MSAALVVVAAVFDVPEGPSIMIGDGVNIELGEDDDDDEDGCSSVDDEELVGVVEDDGVGDGPLGLVPMALELFIM
jgi:hypothetical protein